MTRLRFLIDTNIFIPLEPTSVLDVGVMSKPAMKLSELCNRAGVGLYLHPAQRRDIANDNSDSRRTLREQLYSKYSELENAPEPSQELEETIGSSIRESNDWVDHCLLEAIYRSCVDFLVSEDRLLHRKARRLGIENVLLLRDALGVVNRLFSQNPEPLPAVEDIQVYSLNRSDPIFDSLRKDYHPSFDSWIDKCSKEHRKAWVIKNGGALGGLCIYKEEDGTEIGQDEPTLKLCTFKVAEEQRGQAYGELLLRSAYEYIKANNIKWVYITAIANKQEFLINYLEDLGFAQIDRKTTSGDVILTKPTAWRDDLPLPNNPAHVLRRYGPFYFQRDGVAAFMVPIQPDYHELLFPHTDGQLELFPGSSFFGNALRKAYLCNASTRAMEPGDLLFFYRSGGSSSVQVVGVVEETLVSRSATKVASFVGKRTLYSFTKIEGLVEKREVLAILFMVVKTKGPSVGLIELVENAILAAAPQSIQSVPRGKIEWLMNQLQL